MSIDDLKSYLKVDDNSDDAIIEALQKAAEEYLANAEVRKNYNKELYTLAIKLLVSHWYENRMIEGEKVLHKLAFSLDAIILQLKYSSDNILEGES